VQAVVRDLNRMHREHPALHYHDFEAEGFEWIDCNDAANSLLSFVRKGPGETLLVVLNFTPVVRSAHRIGVPQPGRYEVIFNSDAAHYEGSNAGDSHVLSSEPIPWSGRDHSLQIAVPPLAGVIFRHCE
jgi:1,4-alpha-glucan branching enzyme